MFDYWRWINSTYPDFSRGSKVLNTLIPCRSISGQVGEKPVLDQITGVSRQILMRQWRLYMQILATGQSANLWYAQIFASHCVSRCLLCFCEGEVGKNLTPPLWFDVGLPAVPLLADQDISTCMRRSSQPRTCMYLYIYMNDISLSLYIYNIGFGGDTIYI